MTKKLDLKLKRERTERGGGKGERDKEGTRVVRDVNAG